MRPMGVITCSAPMNPTANVTYTHKKFKRAQLEACDTTSTSQHPAKEALARNGKTEASTLPPLKAAAIYTDGSFPVNGFVSGQGSNSTQGSYGQPPLDTEDGKRKNNSSTGGKYKCVYCGLGCAKPSVLDKHIRTHTNERPYSCDQCSIAFKTKSNYLKHTRSQSHKLRCDGGTQDGSDGTVESSDNLDVDGDDGSGCFGHDGGLQYQPTDLSITQPTSRDHNTTSHSVPLTTRGQEDVGKDRGSSIYKPKFRHAYSSPDEGLVKGQSPPIVRQQSAPAQVVSSVDNNTGNLSTYQVFAATHPSHYSHNAHSSASPHSPNPASLSKACLPPLDIHAATKKEDGSSSSQLNSVATTQNVSSLWKGIKSPSPEIVGRHITKLIVENQAIVDTNNPLWSRRYKRQSSIGSSSSESDGSGSGKSRRCSLVESGFKAIKTSAPGPPSTGSAPLQTQPRERSHSFTSDATMVERQSLYSPSLPPTPNLPLAQPTFNRVSASKPSISLQGIATSSSQSAPALTASHMTLIDPCMVDGSHKRCMSEGPSVMREVPKNRIMVPEDPALLRQVPRSHEGSVIKNLLETARAGIASAIDETLERHERARIASQAIPPGEVLTCVCMRCRTPFRNPEELEMHMRHCCSQRVGTGSERGTPDSVKSGDAGRWVAGEQDEALDLQKKPEHMDRERSSSRGSSSGEPPNRRGSQDDARYRCDASYKVYRSKSVPDGVPQIKRKISEVDGSSHDRSTFLSPIYPPGKGYGGCKSDISLKMIDDINKQNKLNNLQLFGGEVQIHDGNELKTMRIDPSKPPSPAMDIRIPPQQLGGGMSKPEVSVPTSVVVTIAKSGLNSGGTMVQVEAKTSTSSTKTVPSLVSSSLHPEQSDIPILSPNIQEAAHPPGMYNTSFSPSFLQYAPHLQLPNLAIPGIPAPDLGSISFSTYSPRTPSHTGLLHPQTPLSHGLISSHKQNMIRSTVSSVRPSPGAFSSSKSNLPHPASLSTGVHPGIHPLVSEAGPQPLLVQEKEKEHYRPQNKAMSASYPALLPVGDEKVPYVPGIPGPYSQANLVNPPAKGIDRNSITNPSYPSHLPVPYVAPTTSAVPHPPLVPSPRDKSLTVPRPREPPNSPVREHCQAATIFKVHNRMAPKDVPSPRPKAPPGTVCSKPTEIKNNNPEIRIHPVASEPVAPEKSLAEKNGTPSESKKPEYSTKIDASESEEFLPPRKRPNFLELKPQPFTNKSSLALIGTTLVSPDTPRPKKSCVQMLLNGSAYTYLGHKVSTKSYFCCIYRQQPMYVPQSTDPKLSMYSNWQLRKPAEDNPLKLPPYQAMGLYESRKYDRSYTIAKAKELNLIQTHSSYWTFKGEKEKTKGKEDGKSKDKDANEVKSEGPSTENVDEVDTEEICPTVKHEVEDSAPEPGVKTSEPGEGSDGGSAKRIKIFEGGFKSTEDYTYVRGRGRGRYVCETCGIRCKKPSMLKKHIRTHTDLRPYACRHCSFSFKTKGNLTKHLRSKAHDKRCEEMGVVPVPTVVDDSHINHRALALQGKLEQEGRRDSMECDDDDDDEDDDDDDGDDDDDDDEDEMMGGVNTQFQDAQGHSHANHGTPSPPQGQGTDGTTVEVKQEPKDVTWEGGMQGERSGVLVMHPGVSTSSETLPIPHATKEGKVQHIMGTEASGDSPMDLSVKKGVTSIATLTHVSDKSLIMKKSPNPRRPSFLPLMSRPSVPDLRSPVAGLASPATPSTPIREHPSEILSPVTESSTLLKSIYNTTERASHVSCEKPHVVPDPTKENGSSSSMLQAYLKERAVLDTTIKRQQYKDSSSDTSPDSPHTNLAPLPASSPSPSPSPTLKNVPTHTSELSHIGKKKVGTKDSEIHSKDTQNGEGEAGACTRDDQSCSSASSSAPITNLTCSSSSNSTCVSQVTIANSSVSQSGSATSSVTQVATTTTTTSRMPTPPANLTVVNSRGVDAKTAFLVPSGVVPSSLNRLGNDDGKCKCTFCHKEFNRHSQLSIHMNIHYMERPYRCDSCAVSFRTNGHLQKHKRSVSHFNKVNMNMTFGTPSTDNPRPFKCRDCKIAFRIHGHLAKHLRSKMHIMKLECLGKLPFGTYAEMERSGANLNEIDTTDCDNSLESLKALAVRLYEKDPGKLTAWQTQQHPPRARTISSSSTSSDDYPMQDDQDDPGAQNPMPANDDDTGNSDGEDEEEMPIVREVARAGPATGSGSGSGAGPSRSPHPHSHPHLSPIEVGSGATAGLVACHLCHEKFLDIEHLSGHLYTVHKVSVAYRNS